MKQGEVHSEKIEVTAQMVRDFAKVSGDFNPIHLDAEAAAKTPFGKPIAHGMLSQALISGIMGTRFPGPGSILLESGLKFQKPVMVGDTITIELTVEKLREDKPIATVLCRVYNGAGDIAAEGHTVLKYPR